MVNQSKREYLGRIKDRYRHAGRKHKKAILDEFCEVCGHHRKHAIRLLNELVRCGRERHVVGSSAASFFTAGRMRTRPGSTVTIAPAASSSP